MVNGLAFGKWIYVLVYGMNIGFYYPRRYVIIKLNKCFAIDFEEICNRKIIMLWIKVNTKVFIAKIGVSIMQSFCVVLLCTMYMNNILKFY